MCKLLTFSLMFLASYQAVSPDEVTDGTELVMAFMIHRHGDRTPVQDTVQLSNDIETLEELIAPYGYGQLTDYGLETAYKLGEYIRKRYDELLPTKYNLSEIYIRSTDSTRTKMTILTAMAAIFPSNSDGWSKTLNWRPTPYHTVSPIYDYNLFTLNCPKFMTYKYSYAYTKSSRLDAYEEVTNALSKYYGYDAFNFPLIMYALNDAYIAQTHLGLALGPELEALMPNITKAASESIDILYGSEDYLPLTGGVLLNEFFEAADTVIAGGETQSIRIYSAHDVTVYAFEAVTQAFPRQGVPRYGALYSLELRRVTATGKYVVLPVYLSDPRNPEEVIYLEVRDCGVLCEYDQFKDTTHGYTLNESDWRTQCDFDPDAEYSLSSIE